jgi:hypothetical protein
MSKAVGERRYGQVVSNDPTPALATKAGLVGKGVARPSHRALGVGLTALLGCLIAAPAASAATPIQPAPAGGVQVAAANSPCRDGGVTTADNRIASELDSKLNAVLKNRLSGYQVSCARAIVETVRDRKLSVHAATIAITTTIVESKISNIPFGDRDSVGLFQQRASWGSVNERMDPEWATNAFLDKMLSKYPNDSWKTEPVGDVCQKVQVSAFPDRYADEAHDGKLIAEAVWKNASHTAEIYGVLKTGELYYTVVDSALGARTHTVRSTQKVGFIPKALVALNRNTLLATTPGGGLHRIDVITNKNSLAFNITADPIESGWTHDTLTFDGDHLYGIAGNVLSRYHVTKAKPGAAQIGSRQELKGNWTLKTLTATAPNWLLGVNVDGSLQSYRINGEARDFDRFELKSGGWSSIDQLISAGDGYYLGRATDGSMNPYTDADPFDGKGDDIAYGKNIDDQGWTQHLITAVPNHG